MLGSWDSSISSDLFYGNKSIWRGLSKSLNVAMLGSFNKTLSIFILWEWALHGITRDQMKLICKETWSFPLRWQTDRSLGGPSRLFRTSYLITGLFPFNGIRSVLGKVILSNLIESSRKMSSSIISFRTNGNLLPLMISLDLLNLFWIAYQTLEHV